MGFSRQEYWSGLPFPSPGDLPNPRIEPESPALQADAVPSEPPGKSKSDSYHSLQLRRNVIQLISLFFFFLITEVNFIHFCKVPIGFFKKITGG